MRKRKEEAWKKCPKCGKIENQIKAWYNASGSQRCKCKECNIYYTINPKQHAYPKETRKLAIKMYYGGISGRNEQIQCNELDKKRAQKWRLRSVKLMKNILRLQNWMNCTGFLSVSHGQKHAKTYIL